MNNTNGSIRISAKIDLKQMEQDLKRMEKQLANYDKEKEKLLSKKATTQETANDLKRELDIYELYTEKAEKYKEKLSSLNKEMQNLKDTRASETLQLEKQEEINRISQKLQAQNTLIEKQADLNAKNGQKYDEALETLKEIDKQIKSNTSNKRKFVNQVKEARDNI